MCRYAFQSNAWNERVCVGRQWLRICRDVSHFPFCFSSKCCYFIIHQHQILCFKRICLNNKQNRIANIKIVYAIHRHILCRLIHVYTCVRWSNCGIGYELQNKCVSAINIETTRIFLWRYLFFFENIYHNYALIYSNVIVFIVYKLYWQ